MKRWIASLLLAMSAASAQAEGLPDDPLRSPVWTDMARRFLADHPVVFDQRVKVIMPSSAEDALNVPVTVDASALGEVSAIVVFADLNPIPKIIEYLPTRARADFSFRFKVEQSTPVRAAVLTADKVWHVGGAWLTAAGGGCTTPSMASSTASWQERFGEVSARLWPRTDGSSRLRLRVIHPMDTGLAARIPVFHIDYLSLRNDAGVELARLRTWEPVSENPLISVDLQHQGRVHIDGRDIQGNLIRAVVTP